MNVSIFEIGMLLGFGAAWPINIYKSLTSKSTKGKSVGFLYVIWLGYVSGILHKLLYSPDFVVWFYALNLVMVTVDIALFHRNRALEKRSETKQ